MKTKVFKNTKYTSQKQWEELLFQAVNNGNLIEVKNLITGKNQPSSPISLDIPSNIIINLECVDKEQCTPLHRAAAKNFADIVYFLLEHGANPNAKNVLQSTPLHFGAASGAAEATNALLNCDAEKNEKDEV
jgi:ankyrin repeat protein